jgi:hypothetical protein
MTSPGGPYSDELGGHRPPGKQASDVVLSYFVCVTDAAGGLAGALLVTDHRARPLHFAFVKPVTPTKMQRLLYGVTLDEYVKVDVIAQKLWQGLPKDKHPDVVLVDAPDLLPARRVTQVPTAVIGKAPDAAPDTSSLSALRFDVGPYAADRDVAGEIIAMLESTCDLLEPFTRVRQALVEGLKAAGS